MFCKQVWMEIYLRDLSLANLPYTGCPNNHPHKFSAIFYSFRVINFLAIITSKVYFLFISLLGTKFLERQPGKPSLTIITSFLCFGYDSKLKTLNIHTNDSRNQLQSIQLVLNKTGQKSLKYKSKNNYQSQTQLIYSIIRKLCV